MWLCVILVAIGRWVEREFERGIRHPIMKKNEFGLIVGRWLTLAKDPRALAREEARWAREDESED